MFYQKFNINNYYYPTENKINNVKFLINTFVIYLFSFAAEIFETYCITLDDLYLYYYTKNLLKNIIEKYNKVYQCELLYQKPIPFDYSTTADNPNMLKICQLSSRVVNNRPVFFA